MAGIDNLDYSNWEKNLYNIAKQVDKDGLFGLNTKEIEIFTSKALEEGIKEATIIELLGASFSKPVKTSPKDNELNKAIDYYNSLDSYARSKITYATYNLAQEKLYLMEKGIDQAFIDCEAYQDILIVPQKRPKPEKLLNFDIEYLRNITQKDMEALHELKDKIEQIIEEANGITEHNTPKKTEYDIEALAQEHLGMSYAEFVEKYKEELEYCKTVTYADLSQMTPTQSFVYGKAKAYAKAMLLATINEAHTVRWDSGERVIEETNKYNDDTLKMTDFEYDGITDESFDSLSSGIMRKSFEEALINEYLTTDIDKTLSETTSKKAIKKVTKKGVVIEYPDGTQYDLSGRKIK